MKKGGFIFIFYIIEQKSDNLQIRKIISEYLKNKYPKTSVKVLQDISNLTAQQSNTYFIINKDICLNERELELAKKIRKNDQFGKIVLISQNIDYLKIFRSHINFLEIIDSNSDIKSEIYSCIDFILSNDTT